MNVLIEAEDIIEIFI